MNNLDIINELEYYAGLMRFRGLSIKNIQQIQIIFDSLMMEGIFYDEFIDIAYPKSNHPVEFTPSFEKALTRLNCKIPKDKTEAELVILKFHTGNITYRKIDPIDGLKKIVDEIYLSFDYGTKTKLFARDSYFNMLEGFYWIIDDILEEPYCVSFKGKYGEDAISEMKKEIFNLTQDWFLKNG